MKKLLAVLLLLASPLLAQDVKISNLTSGSPVQATDMIPIARGGANFRLAGSDFLSSAGGATGCTTPPFSFTADTNAGMCISAANQLVLQTGASNPRGVLSLAYAAANPNVFLQAISSGGVQSGFYAEDPDAGPPEASVYVGGVKKFVFSSSAGLTLGGSGTGYDGLGFYPPSEGAGPFNGYFTSADLTADRTWTMPNATGDVPVLASSGIFVRTAAQTFAARSIAAGTGISVSNGDGVAGNPTPSVDTATTPQFSSGTGLPGATCTVGQTYMETDVPRSCECTATNTWTCSSQARTHATDCTALTDGLTNDLCWELDSERAFLCQPTAGGCDTGAEWIAQTVSAAQISSGDVAFSQIAQASGASVLVGRGSAGGAGDFQEITLGSGLSMSGTVLSASGSSFDPYTSYTLYEEWESNSGTGRNDWLCSGTCARQYDTTRGDVDRLTTTASDNNASTVRIHARGERAWNKDWDLDFDILPGSNSTTIADAAIFVGFIYYDESSTANAAVWVRYDTDRSDSTWVFQVCNGLGATGCGETGDSTYSKVVVSTISPVAGTWNRGRLSHKMNGVGGNETYYFQMDTETQITMCSSGCTDTITPGTHVPTSGSAPSLVIEQRTRTTTAKSLDTGYVYLTATK